MPAPENLNIQQPGEPAKTSTETGDTSGQQTQQATTTTETPAAPAYKAVHKGGGKHIIVDADGNQVGDFRGDKNEAAAEIARLLAGGEPLTKPAPPANELDDEPPAKASTASVDPFKIKQPVLTEEGWVCPAPKVEG